MSKPNTVPTADLARIPWVPRNPDVTSYNGTAVVWDADRDERILTLIDDIHAEHRGQLLVASYHEGSVVLIWRGPVPDEYKSQWISVSEDSWIVEFSGSTSQST